MLISTKLLINNFRLYSQLIASIIKSSYIGLLLYLITVVFSKKTHLRVNSVIISSIILALTLAFSYPLIINQSDSALSFLRTLILWMLPILYFALGSRELNTGMFEKLLVIIFFYTFIEFFLINFTSISLFESDRYRSASIFGFIRSEGVSHNSSISSALVVSIFLRLFIKNGFKLKFFLISSASIILLASGAGFLLFIFSILFFVVQRKILLFTIFFVGSILLFFNISAQFAEIILNIHPKISYEYISFLIELKLGQLIDYFGAKNINTFYFGNSILNNQVITSGDFGFLTIVEALGLPLALTIISGVLIMFVRASTFGNFPPFLILLIETIHYPVFIDPISAYLMAQYAMAKINEV